MLTTLFSVYSLIDFLIFILGEVVFNTNEQKTATVGRVPRVNRMSSFYGDLNSSSATLERYNEKYIRLLEIRIFSNNILYKEKNAFYNN